MYSTRPQRKTLTKLCPYCGKTRTYTYRDGYDEVDYGTGRSRYIPSKTEDDGCDCMFGKLDHTVGIACVISLDTDNEPTVEYLLQMAKEIEALPPVEYKYFKNVKPIL